jgi:hypothetical protein
VSGALAVLEALRVKKADAERCVQEVNDEARRDAEVELWRGRWRLVALAPIVGAILLAGCGGNSSSTTTTTPTPHGARSRTPAEVRAAYSAGYETAAAMRTRRRSHSVLVSRCESKYGAAVGTGGPETANAARRAAFNRGCLAGLASR